MIAVLFLIFFAFVFCMISVAVYRKNNCDEFLLRRIDAERENDRRRNEYIKHLRGVK